MNQELFAKKLEVCFRAKGYTKASFAKALGIRVKQLDSYLADASRLRLSMAVKISRLLNVKISFLVSENDIPAEYLQDTP